MRRLSTLLLAAVAFVALLAPAPAHAIYRDSSIDFGGSLRTTNIFRNPDIDKWYFIMQRNSLKLRLEYKWLQRGKAFGKWNMPFLERSDLFVLYRGVYDSVYDTTPSWPATAWLPMRWPSTPGAPCVGPRTSRAPCPSCSQAPTRPC